MDKEQSRVCVNLCRSQPLRSATSNSAIFKRSRSTASLGSSSLWLPPPSSSSSWSWQFSALNPKATNTKVSRLACNSRKAGFGKRCIFLSSKFITYFLRPNEVVRVIRLRSSNNRANSEGGKSLLPSTDMSKKSKNRLRDPAL